MNLNYYTLLNCRISSKRASSLDQMKNIKLKSYLIADQAQANTICVARKHRPLKKFPNKNRGYVVLRSCYDDPAT